MYSYCITRIHRSLSIAFLAVVSLWLTGCGGGYPSPTVYELQVQEIEKQDALDPPAQHQVVVFGSSSVQLWDTIEDDLYPVPIIQRGFFGNTMNDALYFADRMIVAYNPQVIVLYDGDNDISLGVSADKVHQVFKLFVERVRESLPNTPIYFISIKPSPARWLGWPRRQDANELIRETCEADDQLHFVDVATAMLDSNGRVRKELFMDDGIHLNDAGYQLWTSILGPILEQAYFQGQ